MFRVLIKQFLVGALVVGVLFTAGMAWHSEAQDATLPKPNSERSAITNLLQLTRMLNQERRVNRDVQLEVTVCAASRPKVGLLIVQDETGVEVLQVGNFDQQIQPGERVRIQGRNSLLRKREMGIELSPPPTVDNDGIHIRRTMPGTTTLEAGQVPIRLDWFYYLPDPNLEVYWVDAKGTNHAIASSNLCHAVVDESSGQTNFLPGLQAECYDGYWQTVPDFDLLQPVKSGSVTNFDPGFRTRDERIGLRYTGFYTVYKEGQHKFRVRSQEGSLLFLGKAELPIVRLGLTNVPTARTGFYGERIKTPDERRWMTLQGYVARVARKGEGLEFELRSDRDVISVRVADASGLEPAAMLKSKVKVTGVGRGVLATDQRLVLGKLFVASGKEVVFVEKARDLDDLSTTITSVAQVQSLRIDEARRALPVCVRGVVTDARNTRNDRWMSIQDETRGIFVSLTYVSNALPAFGEYWEVKGHSGAGDFAPVLVAEKVTFLGDGRMPAPVQPSWRELVNGSRDVQWAELQGLVTAVQTNTVTLLLPEGHLDVQMEGHYESQLRSFQNAVVRISGVLYAVWNAESREVRVGTVLMRNATVSVDTDAPADPFDAPVKAARELFMFDPQASAFQRVKIRGQVIYADANRVFVMDGKSGLRVLPAQPDGLRAGDLIEAVGYPEISGPSPVLREAIVRKTGAVALPEARVLSDSDFAQGGLDSTRVMVRGKLLGSHRERDDLVLEMQSSTRLFQARLGALQNHANLQTGSRLALTGTYVGRGNGRASERQTESFELLLNSPADISVLSKPPWWTLQRLLTVLGVLLVVLLLAFGWIALLRRQVEQRTAQLRSEIRERERAERQHALEAERTRIARDLHDDLGSSLTEISVLAGTGQFPIAEDSNPVKLFRAIAAKTRSLVAALDVIVWAVNPEDNSLQTLADYLTGFAREFLAHSSIACRFKMPVTFPTVTLDGQVRHGLLMAVKESLNNIVRHAEATEVEFRMAVVDGALEIVIADNGHGFDQGVARRGHGLKNLSARLGKLGGNCVVESRVAGGTIVKIQLALPAMTP